MFFKGDSVFKRCVYAALYEYVKESDEIKLLCKENKYLLDTDVDTKLDLEILPEKGDKIYFPDTDSKLVIADTAIGVDGKTYYWLEPRFDESCDIAKQSYAECMKERDKYKRLQNEDE